MIHASVFSKSEPAKVASEGMKTDARRTLQMFQLAIGKGALSLPKGKILYL
jgi:hypothetical protein